MSDDFTRRYVNLRLSVELPGSGGEEALIEFGRLIAVKELAYTEAEAADLTIAEALSIIFNSPAAINRLSLAGVPWSVTVPDETENRLTQTDSTNEGEKDDD